MNPDAAWLENLIIVVVIGGFLGFIAWRLIAYRRRGSRRDPLPRLERVARSAVVIAVHPARARPARTLLRGNAPADAGNPEAWLIEVEYADAAEDTHRACLADLIPTGALDRFTIGARCRVYAFDAPPKSFQADAAPGEPAPRRCLLAEEHGGVPRAGFDLDGVRAHGATDLGCPACGVADPRGDAVRDRRGSLEGRDHRPALLVPRRSRGGMGARIPKLRSDLPEAA